VGASPNCFEAKRFLLGTRNFLLHWSYLDLQCKQIACPRNDTSTGSLETQSGPTESLYVANLLTNSMSIPFPNVCTVHLQSSPFVSSGWSAPISPQREHNCYGHLYYRLCGFVLEFLERRDSSTISFSY